MPWAPNVVVPETASVDPLPSTTTVPFATPVPTNRFPQLVSLPAFTLNWEPPSTARLELTAIVSVFDPDDGAISDRLPPNTCAMPSV